MQRCDEREVENSTRNKRKVAKYRNVQLELICGFAETYFTKMYCGDWVEQKKYLLED